MYLFTYCFVCVCIILLFVCVTFLPLSLSLLDEHFLLFFLKPFLFHFTWHLVLLRMSTAVLSGKHSQSAFLIADDAILTSRYKWPEWTSLKASGEFLAEVGHEPGYLAPCPASFPSTPTPAALPFQRQWLWSIWGTVISSRSVDSTSEVGNQHYIKCYSDFTFLLVLAFPKYQKSTVYHSK